MKVTPVKTRVFLPPQDDLFAVLDECDITIREQSVLAVTAKVGAIHQGRCVSIPQDEKKAAEEKDDLIRRQAQWYLERDSTVPYPRMFTIYEGTFCSSCGIDASNSNGYWTLLPKDSDTLAQEIRTYIQKRFSVKNIGVIIIDSRTFPMRNGTIGMTLGYAGFKAQFDYRGTNDLFDRPFEAERINIADCLASSALLAMGEGSESTPVALIEDIQHIEFADDDPVTDPMLLLKVPMEDDVFKQFFKNHPWKPGWQ